MSILQDQIASQETPGSKNFVPFTANSGMEEKANEYLSHYPETEKRSAVLPLVHMVQHQFGYVSPEAMDWIAGKLEIAAIKVEEVVTFYPGIRQSAPGKYHIRVCRTLSCAMGGSHELMTKLCELSGIDQSEMDPHSKPIVVSPCGNWSVEFAECLASCGTAPVCLVNDDFHEAVSEDKAQGLMDQYSKESN